MELTHTVPRSKIYFPNLRTSTRTQIISSSCNHFSPPQISLSSSSPNPATPKAHPNSLNRTTTTTNPHEQSGTDIESTTPTMSEIMDSSKAQNLHLQLQTLGPFFRIIAKSLETQRELGRAEGLIRVWLGGKILHLDSIRLRRETLGMEKSIFGIGVFIGAVAIRHGYDCGCRTAELLAINDANLYHSKVHFATSNAMEMYLALIRSFVSQLVRFYTRIGFKVVHEVTGSSVGDLAHMLVWGGIGTRMDADVEELLVKWCRRFKSQS
ncbi:unnamed protein product [Ilex paraguariensis]|uniref:Acyl-CoA N-acyltransferase n=1 Tax=Ilex paraguariensis TaxID=185542 RepID=A0ABC8UIK1_9AQUA